MHKFIVNTHRGALREFVCSHHLHIQVLALRLPPGFDQSLEHLTEKVNMRLKVDKDAA